MPLLDIEARNASLDNDYGATHGPNAPASHELALYAGDPAEGGLELEATTEVEDADGIITVMPNGYARVTLPNDATIWPPAADGLKESVLISFPVSTEAYSATATHWALIGADGAYWDAAELMTPADVTGPGQTPVLTLSVFYDELTD